MIIKYKKINSSQIKNDTSCAINVLYVKISDINERVREMIEVISDNSWINSLNPIEQVSFAARERRTRTKLIQEIFSHVDTILSVELGEYIISCTAQTALENKHQHKKVPLAELLKEKVVGNPGFDFHTETSTQIISFGEAKYSGSKNPYGNALLQINEFIKLEKDVSEYTILQHFISNAAMAKAMKGTKAYTAAFSINSSEPRKILSNVLKSKDLESLFVYEEIYIIGVEICAK